MALFDNWVVRWRDEDFVRVCFMLLRVVLRDWLRVSRVGCFSGITSMASEGLEAVAVNRSISVNKLLVS